MKTISLFLSALFFLTVSGRSARDVDSDESAVEESDLPSFVTDSGETTLPDITTFTSFQEILPTSPDSQPGCKCDWRYFKHYEAKGCRPVLEQGCNCPVRFDCPAPVISEEDKKVCKYKDKVYEDGDRIITSNPCEICSCRSNILGPAITCISVECPHHSLEKGCYEVYEADKCCPVRVQCDFVCEFEGETYSSGQRMYSKNDPCLSCLCDQDWTGVKGNSCQIHECFLERKLEDLRRGCIPIYHEKTCCPIEFHCGDEEVGTSNTVPLNSEDANGSTLCFFQGKSYGIGEVLDIKHPTNCVNCTCSTPPDFTCIHKSCSPPPNNDYVNCKSTYKEGECCPTYECIQQ